VSEAPAIRVQVPGGPVLCVDVVPTGQGPMVRVCSVAVGDAVPLLALPPTAARELADALGAAARGVELGAALARDEGEG
jgi:hypothetical protein